MDNVTGNLTINALRGTYNSKDPGQTPDLWLTKSPLGGHEMYVSSLSISTQKKIQRDGGWWYLSIGYHPLSAVTIDLTSDQVLGLYVQLSNAIQSANIK